MNHTLGAAPDDGGGALGAEAARLRPLLDMLTAATRAMIDVPDRVTLLGRVCEALALHGGFAAAITGADLDGDGWMELLHAAGPARAYADGLRVPADGSTGDPSPAGLAIRTGRPVVSSDIASDPLVAPWAARAHEHGLRSMAVLPIPSRTMGAGALGVYATTPGAFGETEVAVLEDLALTVGLAIDALADRDARRGVESDLAARETQLRAAFDALVDPVAILTPVRVDGQLVDERIDYTNRAWRAEFLGDPDAPDPVGAALLDRIPEAAPRLAVHRRVLETGEPQRAMLEFVRDGRPRWFDMEFIRLGDGVIVLSRDVSETRQALGDLRASEERYRQLVDEVDAMVFVHDVAADTWFISGAVEAVTGYPLEHLLVDANWRAMVVEEDRDRVFPEWDDLTTPRRFDLAYRIRRADGRIAWLEERWSSTTDEDGAVTNWFGVAWDVTARKHLEQSIARTGRLEAVSRVTAAAAHDFGNVLMSIRIFQGNLAMEIAKDDPIRADVDAIGQAVEKGATLTHRLLVVGHETHDDDPEALDPAEVVAQMTPILRGIAKPAELVVETTDSDIIEIVRPGLEQALLNLVINARDAVGDRPGTIRISVDHEEIPTATGSDVKPGRYLAIRVQDDGAGMSPDTLDRAFEPFFSTKDHGTGIGLSSVFGTVREAGGTVRIESALGAGTTVILLLPPITPPRPSRGRHRVRRSDNP